MRNPFANLPILFITLLLAAGPASAQNLAGWALEERAAEGCVQEVWLRFEGAAGLANHGPRSVCGATPLRAFPDSPPSGTVAVGWKDRNGESHTHLVPLETILRRENLRMPGTVLEFIFRQNTVEVWSRPLASAIGVTDDRRQRIFFAGIDVTPSKRLPPGIHRQRE